MPSPSKKPPTNVKPVPGTIVWVRRRNGSWWPGRIISKKELLASNVMSPRSGTPVKLLGRDDASVDWYNIEKSKRVKAFRCGEFDECIERAQAMAGMQSKRREKYARREDAIVDAIELEKEQIEQLRTASPMVSGGKKSRIKGKQKSVDGDQSKKGNAEASGSVRKFSRKNAQGKTQAKERDTSDLDDGPALLPRMRGLQDLVSAGTSSKNASGEGCLALEGSSEASLLDDSRTAQEQGEQGKSMKRKRSTAKAEEAPSKRRDRKKPILQVLETLQRDKEDSAGANEQAEQQLITKPKTEGVCEGENNLPGECESTQETLTQASNKNTGHFLDAHSASYNSKVSTVAASEGMLPSSTCSGLQQEKAQVKKEKGKGTKKKKASIPPRTLASLVDAGAAEKQEKDEENLNISQVGLDQKSTVSRLDASTVSVCRTTKAKQKVEAEETVTACCPSLKSDGQKESWKEGPVHPRTRFEKQPVPVVPLFSTVTQKSVHGYPVSVEVVEEMTYSRRRKPKSRNGEDSPFKPSSWQTAKRTARQRTPRSDIPATYEESPGSGKVKKRSKEALSKRLLKKAVLTSKKIRTLASISEERKRQPQAAAAGNGLGMLSSEVPPRWPVATLVPVSVALNRLRAVVCS